MRTRAPASCGHSRAHECARYEIARAALPCLVAVIIPFVIPWRYVFAHYLKKPAERWR